MTSRIYEHNADVCNFPGMSGNYAHAHAIFTRRYFSLDQRLGTRLGEYIQLPSGLQIPYTLEAHGITITFPVRNHIFVHIADCHMFSHQNTYLYNLIIMHFLPYGCGADATNQGNNLYH